ncbi:L-alanine-DL-glutamate epimerase-like enolase superfamily enzyme [Agromyces terreus]|uniref:L-alanine-DL-glutamate epimerase-like enolase superfamily enzyme n=1 Tax=Agromyces terreus TaxID=424795 RepID=A0A9X2K9V6_9MICO|nr:hypothetical protein [Agromyces terreus]MCP2369653.1 L-alanine-DL-glutamate epimerase-like enolase superfamily enzyme [Agromyces terreus]
MHHRASGHSFGPWNDERANIDQILDLGLPVGLVVGSGDRVDVRTIRLAAERPFAYFDLYASEMPDEYVDACGTVAPMVALGPDDTPEDAARLERAGVRAFEVSTLRPELYGSPLAESTLERIRAIRASVSVPLVVPSQHRLRPDDVAVLLGAGADAVLLGAVVLGHDTSSISEVLPSFIEAAAGTRTN